MVSMIGGIRIVDISRRLRRVSIHSRRRTVQTMWRASGLLLERAGARAGRPSPRSRPARATSAPTGPRRCRRRRRPAPGRSPVRRTPGSSVPTWRSRRRRPRPPSRPDRTDRGDDRRHRPGARRTASRGHRARRAGRPASRPAAARRGRRRSGRTAVRPRRGCASRARSSARPAQRLDRLPNDERGLGIEGGGRLVEEDDRRLVEQRPGDGQLLLHALAEGAGHVVAPIPQLEEAQVALDPLGSDVCVEAVQPAEEVEVRARRQFVVQPGRLGQDADPRPDGIGSLADVEAVDRRRALGRRDERGQQPDGRGLAGTVGPEQPEDLPRRTANVTSRRRPTGPRTAARDRRRSVRGRSRQDRRPRPQGHPRRRSCRRVRTGRASLAY